MTDYLKRYNKGVSSTTRPMRCKPHPGEIWWVTMLDGIKDRPVLVLSCSGDSVVFLKCTSQPGQSCARNTIDDCFEAGLDKRTYVDPERRSVHRSRLLRKMGSLSEYDRSKFGLREAHID